MLFKRPRSGRGLRTRPDRKLIYCNRFKPKGQEFKCPRVNNTYLTRRNPTLPMRVPGSLMQRPSARRSLAKSLLKEPPRTTR